MSGSYLQLRRSARLSAHRRSHFLTPFRKHSEDHNNTCATAICRNCGMTVTVNTRPAPNQIDIGGEAVALNCPNPAR